MIRFCLLVNLVVNAVQLQNVTCTTCATANTCIHLLFYLNMISITFPLVALNNLSSSAASMVGLRMGVQKSRGSDASHGRRDDDESASSRSLSKVEGWEARRGRRRLHAVQLRVPFDKKVI